MHGFTTRILHNTHDAKKDSQGVRRYPVYDCSAFEFDSAEDIADILGDPELALSRC